MKLLFDHNLSPRLIGRLSDMYPDAIHVTHVNLSEALDQDVWEYAREHDLIIITKDADFSDLSVLHGSPPKILWLRIGNCTTDQVETLLRNQYEAVRDFVGDLEVGVLELL